MCSNYAASVLKEGLSLDGSNPRVKLGKCFHLLFAADQPVVFSPSPYKVSKQGHISEKFPFTHRDRPVHDPCPSLQESSEGQNRFSRSFLPPGQLGMFLCSSV